MVWLVAFLPSRNVTKTDIGERVTSFSMLQWHKEGEQKRIVWNFFDVHFRSNLGVLRRPNGGLVGSYDFQREGSGFF